MKKDTNEEASLAFYPFYVSTKMHSICIQKCTKIRGRDKLYPNATWQSEIWLEVKGKKNPFFPSNIT